jgi:hypothetical protein
LVFSAGPGAAGAVLMIMMMMIEVMMEMSNVRKRHVSRYNRSDGTNEAGV